MYTTAKVLTDGIHAGINTGFFVIKAIKNVYMYAIVPYILGKC